MPNRLHFYRAATDSQLEQHDADYNRAIAIAALVERHRQVGTDRTWAAVCEALDKHWGARAMKPTFWPVYRFKDLTTPNHYLITTYPLGVAPLGYPVILLPKTEAEDMMVGLNHNNPGRFEMELVENKEEV